MPTKKETSTKSTKKTDKSDSKKESDPKKKKTKKTTKSKSASKATSTTKSKSESNVTKSKSMDKTESKPKISGMRALAAARASSPKRRSLVVDPASKGRASVINADVNLTDVAPVKPASKPEVKVPEIDPVRFSVRRDQGGSRGTISKVLTFILVVVLVGVGLVFLFEQFINSNAPAASPDDVTQIQEEEEVVIDGISIDKEVKPDSAATMVSSNDDFISTDSSIGSPNNVKGEIVLDEISYMEFESFGRFIFSLSGANNGLPPSNVSMNADGGLVVKLNKVSIANEEMLSQIDINGENVWKMSGTKTGDGVGFTIDLLSNSKYVLKIEGSDLYVDIKSDEQLSSPVVVEEPEPEPDPTPVAPDPVVEETPDTTAAPTSENYNNPKSQDKQYVVSKVDGNKLVSETYYYRDDVSSFLFSWAIKGTGKNYVPNASAELIQRNGVNYIEVTVNNLRYDRLHSSGKTKAVIGISTAGTPLVDVLTKGFSSGTAKFWVKLSRKADYKLYSTLTYQGYQLLTLEVFD